MKPRLTFNVRPHAVLEKQRGFDLGGETIDDFLEEFPTVSRKQVITFLEEAKERMGAAAL